VLLVLLVVLNLALVGAVMTSEAPYGPYNGAWDGTSELRTSLTDDADLTLAHSTTQYGEVSGEAVAIVVAPQESYGPTDTARLRQFVQRGGTLVVMSDDNRTNPLLEELEVETRIDGRQLRDERENYRSPALPVATETVDHPYTDDVDGLTLNYGTALNISTDSRGFGTTWDGQYLVNSSGFAYIDRNGNETLDADETLRERPVATLEPVGQGQVLVVSDASVVTNAMLERSGNKRFVQNLAGTHEQVLLDYSHGHPLPPLVYALLLIRATPWVQFALGLATVAFVVLWTRGFSVPLPDRIAGQSRDTPSTNISTSKDDLTAFLAAEHPDWDEDRIERVTQAIIRRREQQGNDD
jgi:hypothetical protein